MLFFSNQSIAIECKTISNVTVLINKLNRLSFYVCDEESSKEHVLLAPCVSPVFWCANVNKFLMSREKKRLQQILQRAFSAVKYRQWNHEIRSRENK